MYFNLIYVHFIAFYWLQTLFVQAVLKKADKDKSSDISFSEFVEYMLDHERKLKLAFSDLDRNKDGKITSVLYYTPSLKKQSKLFMA